VQALLTDVNAWDDARRIRGFVAAMTNVESTSPEWINWALSIANKLDPTKDKKSIKKM
jgi:hypothetical protein